MSATTPHRTNMTTQHSPSKTPSRRVLGDLAPKAINTPLSQTKAFDTSEVTQAQSPLKQTAPTLLPAFDDKENLASSTTASKGKKRGIDEVDSAESVENLKMLARGRDESLSNTGDWLTSAAMQRHTVSPQKLHTSVFHSQSQGKQPHRPRRPRIAYRVQHAITRARTSATLTKEQPVLL